MTKKKKDLKVVKSKKEETVKDDSPQAQFVGIHVFAELDNGLLYQIALDKEHVDNIGGYIVGEVFGDKGIKLMKEPVAQMANKDVVENKD